VIREPCLLDSFAVRTFDPNTRFSTRPRKRPSERTANALVTSRPPTSTFTERGSTPLGTTISTSASPSEIRSARFESTLIFKAATVAGALARAAGTAADRSVAASAHSAMAARTATPLRARFIGVLLGLGERGS